MINDVSEYIISIFTMDGRSVYSLYLRKPTGDSWGLSANDSQQYSLTPCKIKLVINFVHPKCYLAHPCMNWLCKLFVTVREVCNPLVSLLYGWTSILTTRIFYDTRVSVGACGCQWPYMFGVRTSVSYTLRREYRVVRSRYSRLLFTSEDRICANSRVQEQSTNITSQCQCLAFAWRHRSVVMTSQS